MAIEVIKRGVKQEDRVAEFTCDSCHSSMRAKVSDGELISDNRDGNYVEFKCPVCNSKITVSLRLFRNRLPIEDPCPDNWPCS